MSEPIIKIEMTGQLDPDSSLFALCMDRAARFPAKDFTEYASRVETLVEIIDNASIQRVTAGAELEQGAND